MKFPDTLTASITDREDYNYEHGANSAYVVLSAGDTVIYQWTVGNIYYDRYGDGGPTEEEAAWEFIGEKLKALFDSLEAVHDRQL